MKNSLLKGLMVFLTMLCTSLTYSQDVSGTVSDASGPLPGASVLVKGTTKGAQTDFIEVNQDHKFLASNITLALLNSDSYQKYCRNDLFFF